MGIKRLIFAGTPDFAVPSLVALIEAGFDICGVYTQPDRPAGRGRQLQPSPVKKIALEHELPVFQPSSLKTPEAQAELIALQADMMIVAAYGLILPPAVLEAPVHGCVNVHASLLPRWRGAAPIHRALLAGDEKTGITIMQMDVGLDTGDMLLKAEMPIQADDNGQSLHDRLAQQGAEALQQALSKWDELKPQTQDEALVTYAHKLEKAEAQLDWNQSAIALERQVRAFNPWPVAQTELREVKLRVWDAKALEESTEQAPGTLLRGHKQGLEVATGEGVLRLLQVQQASKRVLPVADFLNAQPSFKS